MNVVPQQTQPDVPLTPNLVPGDRAAGMMTPHNPRLRNHMNSRFSFHRCLRALVVPLCVLSSAFLARAGEITGRVADATNGGFLSGADVTLVDRGRSTTTNREGRFSFADVGPGTVSVRVDYLGLDSKVESVTVPSTGSVTVDLSLGEGIVTLGEYVVEGYREGRSKALQQKRSAEVVMDVISADAVGNLPDRNVAEALSRVPGINLDVISGGGEGRFVSIRGIEPNFNNVTLNGATMAAPTAGGREGRAMPLDVVSSSQISQIEVIKSPTPDMDGNVLGGTVNIKTVSAFDREKRFLYGSAEIGKNKDADGSQYEGQLTYGDTFADGKLGIALSGNYSKRPYVVHAIQANWDQTDDGQWYVSTLELQPTSGEKVRKGIDFNLELRPSAGVELYLRGLYNKFTEDERNQEFIQEARRDPVFIADKIETFDRMRFEQRDFRREVDQTVTNITAGGKFRIGDFTYEGDVTYSRAKEDVPFIRSVQFRTGNVNMPQPFGIDFNSFTPSFNAQGITSGDPSIFPLRRYRLENSFRDEKTWTPRFDVRKDFHDLFGGRSGYFKTGFKYTHRHRFVDDNSVRPVNGDLTMADIAPPGPGYTFMDGRYMYPSTLDVDTAVDYYNAHSGDFEIDDAESAANSTEDDYDITEKILALYGMASVDLSEHATILGGVRYEKTNATLAGPEYRELNGDFAGVVINTSDFSYDNFMPNLQFRYRINDQSIIRFAVTATIGRPQYEKAAPKSVLEVEENPDPDNPDVILRSGVLEIGNPDLSPYESWNFDVSYEYYLKSGGLLSVGLFKKNIDNPIYQFHQEDRDVTYNGFLFDSLSTTKQLNAKSATVDGVELNLQLPFAAFVDKGFLAGFGVDSNATFVHSTTDLFDRPKGSIPFFRQPRNIWNAGFYFQNYGVTARIAYNRQTQSLRELGDTPDDDIWDSGREFTDFQASYKINENLSVYLNWQNIFKSRQDQTSGKNSGRVRRAEFYGAYLRGGVRFRF